MENKNNQSTTLFCFSPLVMIVTFAIEIAMAMYVVWRYGLDRVTRIVALILVNLAVFQLAEYMICTGALGLTGDQWARVGHVAITLLPPLGLHLGMRLANKENNLLLGGAYGMAILFSSLFLFVPQGIQGAVCAGNYVIFERGEGLPFWPWSYALYYYGWLAIGTKFAWKYASLVKKKNISRALYGLMFGYLLFIVPTTAVNLVDPTTINAIPSIMCGFAVLLAFMLTFKVVPEYKSDRGIKKVRLALRR